MKAIYEATIKIKYVKEVGKVLNVSKEELDNNLEEFFLNEMFDGEENNFEIESKLETI